MTIQKIRARKKILFKEDKYINSEVVVECIKSIQEELILAIVDELGIVIDQPAAKTDSVVFWDLANKKIIEEDKIDNNYIILSAGAFLRLHKKLCREMMMEAHGCGRCIYHKKAF